MKRYVLENGDQTDFFASLIRYRKTIKERSKAKLGMKLGHYHTFYEIGNSVFSKDEERNYYIYGQKYKFNTNCFVGAPPNEKHVADRGDKKQRFLINFSEEYGREVFGFLGVDINEFFKNPVLYYSDEQVEKLLEIGEELVRESRDAKRSHIDVRKNYRLKLLFVNFVSILIQPIDVGVPVSEVENVTEEIIKYVKRNYQKPVTVDFIADKFCVNKYVMCRKFKERTGTSLMDFVIRIRLNHARELLEETCMSICEIAEMVGYNSAKHFSSEFKKKIGVSPVKYRENMRKDV